MTRELKFKAGQLVRINDGIKSVDSEVDIGGWHGRIVELNDEDKIMLIAFDSITLRQIPIDYIDNCEEEGMDWEQYYIGYDEVAPADVRDTEADVETAIGELAAQTGWSYLGAEGQEINAILADIDINDTLAQMRAWQEHFEATLTFPFKAIVDEWQEPRSPVKSGERVRVLSIVDVDEMYGVLVNIKRKFNSFVFPLCDLKAFDPKSPNHAPVQLYAVWYANR